LERFGYYIVAGESYGTAAGRCGKPKTEKFKEMRKSK
jgi:hypothetical protein